MPKSAHQSSHHRESQVFCLMLEVDKMTYEAVLSKPNKTSLNLIKPQVEGRGKCLQQEDVITKKKPHMFS